MLLPTLITLSNSLGEFVLQALAPFAPAKTFGVLALPHYEDVLFVAERFDFTITWQ
jgi:hypothetical protein